MRSLLSISAVFWLVLYVMPLDAQQPGKTVGGAIQFGDKKPADQGEPDPYGYDAMDNPKSDTYTQSGQQTPAQPVLDKQHPSDTPQTGVDSTIEMYPDDSLDDLDSDLYGTDDLDDFDDLDDLDAPQPPARQKQTGNAKQPKSTQQAPSQSDDILDDLPSPYGSQEDDVLDSLPDAYEEGLSREILLDPADPDQMRTLEIDISIHPADVIMLRNGETVEGVIRKKTDDFVSIETATGLHIYNHDDIEFIDEISEEERFYLLDKLEALQVYHKRHMKQELEETKKEMIEKKRTADAKQETLDRMTGTDDSNLFNLTMSRLEEIIKEFSQFSPDYWRYYHRKRDAQTTVLQLNRLRRYAHADIVEIIDLYLRAFDNKIKELNEPQDSRLTESYRDNYEKLFRMAENRRKVLTGTNFN